MKKDFERNIELGIAEGLSLREADKRLDIESWEIAYIEDIAKVTARDNLKFYAHMLIKSSYGLGLAVGVRNAKRAKKARKKLYKKGV